MSTYYHVSPIAITLFVVYLVSFLLYKTKRIRVTTHRKIWNVLLLITFLVTAVFGLIMAVRRDYVLLFSSPINLIYWHVEAGVTMSIISIFHLTWHFSYYLDLFKRGGPRKNAATQTGCDTTEDDS